MSPWLFPDGEIGYGKKAPVSESFQGQLREGEKIPWGAWIKPLISWSGILVPWWAMMIAMAAIVYPQWRFNERLQFPLLVVQQRLCEAPEAGKYIPPMFRSRAFLIGLGSVFIIHFMAGLKLYFPDKVPAIPVQWDISSYFTEQPWNFLPSYIKQNRIHFIYLGIAFFMPNRVGFSIWFFQLLYAAYFVVGNAYMPPFYFGTIQDHNTGAFFGVAAGIFWLGRAHWFRVARNVFGFIENDEDRCNRINGITFLVSCIGMIAWFLWTGMSIGWALLLLLVSIVFALVITRIVAETGLPLIAPETSYAHKLLRIVPASWHNASSAFLAASGHILLVMETGFAFRLSRLTRLDWTPMLRQKNDFVFPGLVFVVILVSLIVCGIAHLTFTYHHSQSIDGRESPISAAYGGNMFNWTGNAVLLEQQRDSMNAPVYNQWFHLFFGAAFAGLLQFMCMNFTWWPLHPVALLFVGYWYAHRVWVSVFLGWLAKVLILRYGGSRVYRSAQPFFIGLVLGEVIAVAFWVIVTFVLALMDKPYEVVEILPF